MNRQGATLRLRILDDDNPGYAHLAFAGGHDILRQQTLSLSVRSSRTKSFLGAAPASLENALSLPHGLGSHLDEGGEDIIEDAAGPGSDFARDLHAGT
jgi:hypothetical protein